jgi:cytochrome c oxidase subunit 3
MSQKAHATAASEPFLAHHFDTSRQQFEAGKLGIWLFLVTEVLFFSGLFCAYAVYRSARPEVFAYAHYYLDRSLGTLNTCVLLVSSLTAALAVRFAQLGQRRRLVTAISLTLLCAFTFLGVKYVEYSRKFDEGLLPGARFNPSEHVWETRAFRSQHPAAAELAERLWRQRDLPTGPARQLLFRSSRAELEPLLLAGVLGNHAEYRDLPSRPRNAHVFFSLYFFMTGLHGVHVLGGIGVWSWLLVRAVRGRFGASYFGPVDYAALYWHLVDLIWIYLFPLLYLIH